MISERLLGGNIMIKSKLFQTILLIGLNISSFNVFSNEVYDFVKLDARTSITDEDYVKDLIVFGTATTLCQQKKLLDDKSKIAFDNFSNYFQAVAAGVDDYDDLNYVLGQIKKNTSNGKAYVSLKDCTYYANRIDYEIPKNVVPDFLKMYYQHKN